MTNELLIKKESRSALGKLLAKENITVNHGNFRTAYFDVKNRVLGLPDWSDKSKSVYDMLLGHEVGHALYTPEWDEDFRKKYKHFDIINILEDIRIERKIQETYAGLPRYFKQGYTELWNDGFFEVDKDPSELQFLDRLNLHAKVGSIVDVPLNDEETEIYNKAYNAESFEDILALYDEVLERSKKEKEELEEDESGDQTMSKPDDSGEIDPSSGGSGMDDDNDDFKDDGTESHSAKSENSDSSDEGETSTGVTDEDIQEAIEKMAEELSKNSDNDDSDNDADDSDASGDSSSMGGQSTDVFKSLTQEKFDSSLEKEANESFGGHKILYPTRKDIFKKEFNDYKTVIARRKDHIAKCEENHDYHNWSETKSNFTDKYSKFKKESKKKVGILVREFEQRKAAWQYARAQESRTGSIDVTKLHKYKYDDQIFASVTTLADAKSHGMIFIVDYSGSMSTVLSGVLLQTLNLTEFCDKVGVPYQVISFTSKSSYSDEKDYELFHGEIDMSDVQLNELLSSKMKKIEKAEAREFLFMQAASSSSYYHGTWFTPNEEGLGGTPLDATLANMGHIIKEFRKNHRVQKLNIITLTDGDSHGAGYGGRYDDRRGSGKAIELDGKIYKIEANGYNSTIGYNKIIGQHYGVNMVGFFLPESKSSAKNQMARVYRENGSYYEAWENAKKDLKEWNKEKHLEMKDALGYSKYYILHTDVDIQEENEFFTDIQDKSGKSMAESKNSQNKLAREFAKHHSSTKNVRILMRKFAETIG